MHRLNKAFASGTNEDAKFLLAFSLTGNGRTDGLGFCQK